MSAKQPQPTDLKPGMDVVGPHTNYIGNVEEVREQDVLVNRPKQSKIYVPTDAIQGVENGRVVLNVGPDDIDLKNWPHDAAGAVSLGGMPARPGPAGSGIPSGEPGYPTFVGNDPDYEPGPGRRAMTSDQEGTIADVPQPGLPGATPASLRGGRSTSREPERSTRAQTESSSDPRVHVAHIKQMLNGTIEHLRDDIDRVDDPKADALFETTAEVLRGLVTAYDHYEHGTEAAWRS